MGLTEGLVHAEAALANPDFTGQERCNALFFRADAEASRGHHADAIVALRELTELRRHSVDWLLLADCERALGHPTAAADALATAVRINPRLWKAHQYLQNYYRDQGDAERAAWHQRRAIP
jgi:tetratricopeptide (TPR) repeat protein